MNDRIKKKKLKQFCQKHIANIVWSYERVGGSCKVMIQGKDGRTVYGNVKIVPWGEEK